MGILSDELGVERVIYSEETIKKRITELGEQIAKDYAGQELIVIGLIRGAMYFLADLTRAIDLPIKVDMIGFTNIPDTTSKTGVVRIIKDIELDIAGKNVLVVEDIIRTGLTTAYIIQNLEMKRPKEIRLCSMLVNPDRLLMTIPVHYCGFEINDNWLAGYGLDREEIGRNLPYIAQIRKKNKRDPHFSSTIINSPPRVTNS